MKGNKILYAGIAILILGIGFAVGTYAYYQNTVTGQVSGTVLAWWCKGPNDSASFTISLGSLYPGSEGTKTIDITSSMAATYTVTFGTFTNMGSGSNHPYLNLYKTHSGTSYTDLIVAGETITGSTTYDSTSGSYKGTATFYYYWPYGNQVDTYNSAAPSVPVEILCTQQNA